MSWTITLILILSVGFAGALFMCEWAAKRLRRLHDELNEPSQD